METILSETSRRSGGFDAEMTCSLMQPFAASLNISVLQNDAAFCSLQMQPFAALYFSLVKFLKRKSMGKFAQ